MNWEEAAKMLRGGMAVGSHTHSHEILTRLTPEEQFQELAGSRTILESRLGVPVQALSYPVGLPHCFSDVTRAAARRAGYRIAFSFYGGFNTPGAVDPYDVVRQSAYADRSIARYQLRSVLAAATGSYWF
jgi:peptidoglycan/xylan/chitin deacetylase (PgdA/CDA1 family)